MGIFSKDIRTMDDLFVHMLRDIRCAENRIVKAGPEMIDKAGDPQLEQAVKAHLGETEDHIACLQEMFRMHSVEVRGIYGPAIDGLIEESDGVAGEMDDPMVLDAVPIAAARAVEHDEMTRYGTLVAWDKQLGRNDSPR